LTSAELDDLHAVNRLFVNESLRIVDALRIPKNINYR